MLRKTLLDKLKIVSPALADNDLIPVLRHFWFRGDHVMGFNDQIAISTMLKTDFEGAVSGEVLLDVLNSSKAKTVELVPEEDHLLMKAASSRIKLGLLHADSMVFQMPKEFGKKVVSNNQQFIAALDNCMRSLGSDTSSPEQVGITMKLSAESIKLYGTNAMTISKASVSVKTGIKNEVSLIMSGTFCKQFLRLVKQAKQWTLYFDGTDNTTLDCGDVVLYGRQILVGKPLEFEKIIARHFKKSDSNRMIEIPTKLKLILERAVIFAGAKGGAVETGATKVTVEGKKVKFVTSTQKGSVTDTLQLAEEHEPVQFRIEPIHLKNGYGSFSKMLLTNECVIMKSGSTMYFVSVLG